MSANGLLQLSLYVGVLIALAKPLGEYMARVYEGRGCGLDRLCGPLEHRIYRLCGVGADAEDPWRGEEMSWRAYAGAMLLFNFCGLLAVYLLQRLQGLLPLNPEGFGAVAPHSAWNVAVSFATNTNWQNYGGETTLSYFTQMAALTVQNFVSAGSGMAVLVALVRGFARREAKSVGNFWVDLVRSILYVLLPLALVLSFALVSQGVVQTFSPYGTVSLLEPTTAIDGVRLTEQRIALGPVASQVAIKQLGTNGGGYYNVNSAHPLENPTPLSNFLEVLAILLIPAALCVTFGRMVRDARQGWALLVVMTIAFVALLLPCVALEQQGTPGLTAAGADQRVSGLQSGGNMEGKEVRFGVVNSALWAVATTAASNGSVNSMHDSFTPLGGLIPLWLMQLGEVIYGGVGSGLAGMLLFVLVAVFIAGLMVGRTPEYLGKKLEAHEMKMASLGILAPLFVVLLGTAVAVVVPSGLAGLTNPGAHGFSEILYAFSSAGNNNGSAFAGLTVDTPFYNLMLGFAMLVGRFWVAIPTLAIAGSLARKRTTPPGPGTLATHTPLFVLLLLGTVALVGALTFLPALALGPIVEQLQMIAVR